MADDPPVSPDGAADPAAALRAAIAALESQRALLGDAVLATALAPLRDKLAALEPAGQRLRLVTVLFADQVGSTALQGALDAEDALEASAAALARLEAVIEAHGGRVLRFMGDGLKAAFGADATREDDALRAVQAALALHEAAQEHAAWLQQRFGLPGYTLRVGLHSGPAMLGGGVEARNTATGFTVNLAARMEQAAPPGRVCISRETADLVRGAFALEAQPPVDVKGVAGPVTTFLVAAALDGGVRRGIDGLTTALVGRAPECRRLLDAWAQALRTRRLVAAAVVGEAGLGKSRLRQELQSVLAREHPQATVLLAVADAQTQLAPYGLLRDLLRRWAASARGDAATPAAAVRQALADVLGDAGQAGQIAALAGLGDDADSQRSAASVAQASPAASTPEAALAALRDWLGRLAAKHPLVLLLDDVHWADEGTLALVRGWLGEGTLPALLAIFTRPELDERAPGWSETAARIDLAPLAADSRAALAAQLLARLPDAPPRLMALVTERAGGNPFYMEEMLRMLIDDGTIDTRGASWTVDAARLRAERVPATLTGVLQARLDALPAAEREAAQAAAVVGAVFWDDALPASHRPHLAVLAQRRLVQRRDGSAFADAVEYEFRHPLLHQVCYDTVLKAPRRVAHEHTALWLAARLGEATAGAHLATTAGHFELGGRRADAAAWYERAARDAHRRSSARDGLALIERWLALLDDDDLDTRFQALNLRTDLHDNAGDRAAQRASLVEIEAIAERAGNDHWRASACVDRALLADRLGDFQEAAVFARRAAELAEPLEEWDQALLGYGEWAWALRRLGRPREAVAPADRAVALAKVHASRRLYGQLLAVRAALAEQLGNPAQAVALLRQAVAAGRESGSPKAIAVLLGNLAGTLATTGAFEEAQAGVDEVLPVLQEIDNRQSLAYLHTVQAQLAGHAGRDDESEALLRQGSAMARAMDDHFSAATYDMQLARRLLRRGRAADAAALTAQARDVFEAGGHAEELLEALAQLAWTCASAGRDEEARVHAEALEQRMAAADAPSVDDLRLELLWLRWRAWAALGEAGAARAAAALAVAHAALVAQLATFDDDGARQAFATNVVEHRELLQAWAARAPDG